MNKKKYYIWLGSSVLLLFVLFSIVISFPATEGILLSPGAEPEASFFSILPTFSAFLMGVLIVFIAALLVLISVS